MTSWDVAFAPVTKARELEPRPQQAALGRAIFDAVASKVDLVAEAKTGTGKSFSYLVPAIFAVREEKRTIISTETTALQDQLTLRDLPFLHGVYGGFKYRSLKGRSWYYCRSRAGSAEPSVTKIIEKLRAADLERLGDGEQRDIEKFVKAELPDGAWSDLGGSTEFCADNRCTAESGCFSSRARDLAAEADIVVTNHAMLRTDADFRASGADDGLLGMVDILVVDEAHTLERVLVDGWTQSYGSWDLYQAEIAMTAGAAMAWQSVNDAAVVRDVKQVVKATRAALASCISFFTQLEKTRDLTDLDEWAGTQFKICQRTVYGGHDQVLLGAMERFEVTTPKALETAERKLKRIAADLAQAAEEVSTGVRKVRKGARGARELGEYIAVLRTAMLSSDAMVAMNSTYYAVTGTGYVGKGLGGEPTAQMRIDVTPLDISWRCARTIWRDVNILTSATLADPTSGDFRYTVKSLGVRDKHTVLLTDSPFDFLEKQLVYVTPGGGDIADCYGARFSFAELRQVLAATQGRALVLFTARSELDWAVKELEREGIDYPVYVQTKTANKQKLADAFRDEKHAVLFATRSFFTGVDFPGDTCSVVVMCKFPLPQYNELCKVQIAWWKERGFPRWYEREALLTFSQAIGRLIRSSSDRGVIALLDQRCANPKEHVAQTAELGIKITGSRVVRDIESVSSFLVA